MNTAADCRAVLGVGGEAGRAEIIAAYRQLAMRWHPDRNDAPQATKKFQEIQAAYRQLQAMHAPRRPQDLWNDTFYGSAFSATDSQPSPADLDEQEDDLHNQYADEYNDGFWHNFPLMSAISLLVGSIAFGFAASPGNWVLFSLAIIVANNVYVTGGAIAALRAESAFRLVVRLYFVGLLGALVWFMASEVTGF